MLNDWKAQLTNTRRAAGALAEANPKFIQAFQALNAAQGANGHLDAKTRELISLAVAVTTRCDGCIDAHVRKAKVAGATREEMAEALGVAIALNAGAAFTYALHVLDAAGD